MVIIAWLAFGFSFYLYMIKREKEKTFDWDEFSFCLLLGVLCYIVLGFCLLVEKFEKFINNVINNMNREDE